MKSHFTPQCLSNILDELEHALRLILTPVCNSQVGDTYNLTQCLTSRLDSTPRRNVRAVDNGQSRMSHLPNEPFIRDNSSVEIDF